MTGKAENNNYISPISPKVRIYKRFSRITILYKVVVLGHLKAKSQFFSSFFSWFSEMASASQKVAMKFSFLHKPCIYARDTRLTSPWFSYIIAVQTVLVLLATLTHWLERSVTTSHRISNKNTERGNWFTILFHCFSIDVICSPLIFSLGISEVRNERGNRIIRYEAGWKCLITEGKSRPPLPVFVGVCSVVQNAYVS